MKKRAVVPASHWALRLPQPLFRLAACGFVLALVGCRDQVPSPPNPAAPAPESLGPAPSVGRESIDSMLLRGDIEGAEKLVRKRLIEKPDDVTATTVLANILADRGQLNDAVAIFEHLARTQPADEASSSIEPSSIATRRRLAELLNRHGLRFDANELLRQIAVLTPLRFDELRGLSFPMLAWVNVTEKPDIHDAIQIQQMGVLTAARALLSQGDVRECLELLSQPIPAAMTGPAGAIESFRLWSLASAQRFDELGAAIATASPGARRYPEYWLAAGNLALSRQSLVAANCFVQAIEREPNCMEAHDGLNQSLRQSGDDAAAAAIEGRIRQVDRIHQLTRIVATSGRLQPELLKELSELSAATGRPLDSLLWQELLIAQLSPGAPQLQVLHDYKRKILAVHPNGLEVAKLSCNIKLSMSTDAVDEWLVAIGRATNVSAAPITSNDQSIAPATPVFRDIGGRIGAKFRYRNAMPVVQREFQIFQAYGSGVACFDFDLDGHVDLYLGQGGSTPPTESSPFPNGLFRQVDGRCADVVVEALADDRRYTTGVTTGDWNQDGYPDVVIGNLGGNRLLINQGDGTFREHAVAREWELSEYTTSLAVADVTGDSLPEIIAVNYLDDASIYEPIQYDEFGQPVMLPGPLHFRPGLDRLFVARGDGTVASQTFGKTLGHTPDHDSSASTGLGLLVTDLDGDQVNEVFVANDLRPNQLWTRDPESGGWTDVAVARGVAFGNSGQPMACMGIAVADFDDNGKVDLHITNFSDQWSNHYMQEESGTFIDRIAATGLAEPSRNLVGFGTQALDYDNNTTWDLVVGNGHVEDFRARGKLFQMPTQCFAGVGKGFEQLSVVGDDVYWQSNHLSRGVAKCDWNADGRIDLAVTDLQQDFVLLKNGTVSDNHWLQIELVGVAAERDAIGTSIVIECGGQSFLQTMQTGDGYLSKNESVLHIGLGKNESIDRLTIRWPDSEQVIDAVRADQRVLVVENEDTLWQRN